MSDPRAMRYWSQPEHETLEETAAFLGFLIGSPGNGSDEFVVEREGQVIGKAGAWAPPEVGFILHPEVWGLGYAFEAMSALIPYLFEAHDMSALTADVDPRNARSLALLGRLGFQETGRAARTLKWRDEWCDSVYLALQRPTRARLARWN